MNYSALLVAVIGFSASGMLSAAPGHPLSAPEKSSAGVQESRVQDSNPPISAGCCLTPRTIQRGEEFKAYLELHMDVALSDTRSRLMPWPDLRTLAH
jgi:hypothetical protein